MSGPFSERVPPQELEAELAVLGSLLLDKDTIAPIQQILRPEDFYADKHRMIYDAVCAVAKRREPIDLITLQAELAARKAPENIGMAYLTKMVDQVVSTANASAYAKLVADASAKRKIQAAAREIMDAGYGETTLDDYRTKAISLLSGAAFNRESSLVRHMGTDLLEFVEKAYNDAKSGRTNTGLLRIGWRSQELRLPMVKGEVTVVAAPSGVGKTTYKNALEAAVAARMTEGEHGAQRRQQVVAFSLEMSRRQILQKAWSRLAKISAVRIRLGSLTDEQWEYSLHVARENAASPVHYAAKPRLRFADMQTELLAFKAKHGHIDLVTIDYWQIIGDDPRKGERPDRMLGRLIEESKALAVELDCHFVILAQAKIDSEKIFPTLEDIKESRDIVAAADNVLFLVKPLDFGERSIDVPTRTGSKRMRCDALGPNGRPMFEGVMLGAQGKQRMGPKNLIAYFADMTTGTFGDLQYPYPWDCD